MIAGLTFRNQELLEQALTHPSVKNRKNNQRLEFLGDSVLGLALANLLYHLYPDENEGALAKRFAALACRAALVTVAEKISMGEHLRLSDSEEAAGGRQGAANLEDAMEALIGALYLDQGFAAAQKFIEQHWVELARSQSAPPQDSKTKLQEWAQARGLPLPSYTLHASDGPSHAPVFHIRVEIQGTPHMAEGTGASKKSAEQQAASSLIEKLGV